MINSAFDVEAQRLISVHGSVQSALDAVESRANAMNNIADKNGVIGDIGPRKAARRNMDLWMYIVDNYV